MTPKEKRALRDKKRRGRDQVVRRDDRIIIRNPVFVRRVGYPMGFVETAAELRQRHFDRINELLRAEGGVGRYTPGDFEERPSRSERDFNDVFRALSRILIHQKGFGGKERTLHTFEVPELLNAETFCTSTKVVKTGTYYGPSGSDDWYEPGGLDPVFTHKLVSIWAKLPRARKPLPPDVLRLPGTDDAYGELWIEAKHVEKVIFDEASVEPPRYLRYRVGRR